MTDIHARIRDLRKHLKMNQTDFGQRLNLSQTAIGQYENGTRNITDRTISQICATFHVSEEWLRTGKGEMLQESETSLFAAFAKQYELTTAEQQVARYLLALSPEERHQILKHLQGLADAIRRADDESTAKAAAREAKVAEYRQELEAQEKGPSASATTGAEKRA